MDEDFIERATALAEYKVAAALAVARRVEKTPSNFDGTCDCGDDVAPLRVQLGYHRCLACQQRLEKGTHKR